ncbi:DUF1289 domain-containing protein [Aliagarivorans marinus]|uniref:DUF1289 domain-containing protein n=1 Tax=Aliagarivorans marinus TaxID=561965 RepID=UPI000A01CF02|nr:DUF1289 domain-containing protein [Aliagarivorans marinus]
MSLEQKLPTVESPCVRNCCLDEQDICLGCFRSIDEIVGWSASSADEKRAVLINCAQRRAQRNSKF